MTGLVLALAMALSDGVAGGNLVAPTRWTLWKPADSATMEVGAIPDRPGGADRSVRVTVTRASDPFWSIMLSQNITPEIPVGARLRLTFWARSATRNPIRAIVEKNGSPYDTIAAVSPTLTPQWHRYVATGANPRQFGPSGIGVRLQMGHQPGTVEFAGVEVMNIGPDPGLVAARSAIEPDAVRKRIRQVRMANLRIVVRDTRGRAVRGATVRVEQKRHAFLFGCNIFMLDPASDESVQREYQERFTSLFNYATLPFYWGAFEPEQGRPQYARLDAMAKWCADHRLITKGHPLVWHEVWPRWAPSDPDAAKSLLQQRVAEIIAHYKGLVRYWDVQNEANNSADYPKTGVGAWVKRDGPATVVTTTLGWARTANRAFGGALLYNDFNTGDANVALLKQLQARKALPDAIGIQSHMHSGPWQETEVWRVAERFAQFGRPIHFTEATVVSGPARTFDFTNPPTDWETTPEGEQKQADFVERFYSILFSHPSVHAITWWDFSDRAAWLNAPSGFLRKDMSPKPVYDRLTKLIHDEWWTRADATCGAAGACVVRVFRGEHDLTITTPDGRSKKVTVLIPITASQKVVSVRF